MDKLKVGILGLRRGIRHLESFLRIEEVDIVGACDRFAPNRARAEEAIASAGGNGVVLHEYDDLLKLEPDAVVVASNGKMQVEHACQAMEAGCHVPSEIPGADSDDELVRLRDTVERIGKTYVLGENACYSDFSRYWRKWVLDGRFGPISIAEGEYLHYLPQTLYLPDGSRLSPSEARAKGITDAEPIWRADQPPIQ